MSKFLRLNGFERNGTNWNGNERYKYETNGNERYRPFVTVPLITNGNERSKYKTNGHERSKIVRLDRSF